jgi:hypothetical protein
MVAIGGITVDLMNGFPATMQQRVDMWQTPGIDGYGAQKIGRGNGEYALSTITYKTSDADANSHIAACAALAGTVVSITDEWGDTYSSSSIVLKVVSNKSYVLKEGVATWRCECQWSLVKIA